MIFLRRQKKKKKKKMIEKKDATATATSDVAFVSSESKEIPTFHAFLGVMDEEFLDRVWHCSTCHGSNKIRFRVDSSKSLHSDSTRMKVGFLCDSFFLCVEGQLTGQFISLPCVKGG